jgi:hypothetical protein
MPSDTGTRLRAFLRLAGSPDDQQGLAGLDLHRLSLVPENLRATLAACHPGRVHVTGTLDRRLILAERESGRWVIGDLSGQPHASRTWPRWLEDHFRPGAGE